MDGVRRWISSAPPSQAQKAKGRTTPQSDTDRRKLVPKQDTDSTEFIAQQLLDPSVSPEEETEYQGCVSLLMLLASGSTSLYTKVHRSVRGLTRCTILSDRTRP